MKFTTVVEQTQHIFGTPDFSSELEIIEKFQYQYKEIQNAREVIKCNSEGCIIYQFTHTRLKNITIVIS